MDFEEWWKEHGYSEIYKYKCLDAYNAGVQDCQNHTQREIEERDTIIKFLKKELIKKTYCRQVMKRQYRELKQKYDSLFKTINSVDTRFRDFVNGVTNKETGVKEDMPCY